MRLIVLTGTSGAGKITATLYFNDIGYYTVDNVPPRLLPALVETCDAEGRQKVLAVVDARGGRSVCELPAVLDALTAAGTTVELIFLDASDEVLVRRFKETRRPHPIFAGGRGSILDAVHAEREMLEEILARADRVIDSSNRTPQELCTVLAEVTEERQGPRLLITVESFGFKHGVPIDADLVLDVRFLRNPHYVPELKGLTGLSPEVVAYIHEDPVTAPFFEKTMDMIRFTLPQYEREGKAYLTIAIGCTGGRHRSVAIAEEMAESLAKSGFRVTVFHRDAGVERDNSVEVPDGK